MRWRATAGLKSNRIEKLGAGPKVGARSRFSQSGKWGLTSIIRIEYGPAVDAAPALPFQAQFGLDAFVVIEKWESMDALKAHASAPHMKAYAAKTKDLIASRVIHILSSA